VKERRTSLAGRAALALAVGAAALAAAFAGAAAGSSGDTSSATSSCPIRSGAGKHFHRKCLEPSDFARHVTNPWFPLKPGSEWRYRGAKEHTPMIDQVRVTDRTKTILGVRTTVVHDVVSMHGRPEEVTNDFYTQDRRGNVWYFGENTKELDRNGNVKSREGSFLAGLKGARAGLFFPAHPRPGVTARQEFFKGHAEDHFKVLSRDARVSVPAVSTNRAVRTKEWTPLEPKTLDNKYYVRGMGTVREIAVKGPQERLELVSFKEG
jgi:hypothetical protein